MPRFSSLVRRWTLAIAMAGLLLGWPLHEARHASEPIAAGGPLGRISSTSPAGWLIGTLAGDFALHATGGTAGDALAEMPGRAAGDVPADTMGEAMGDAPGAMGGPDGPDGGSGTTAQCLWCMFHADHLPSLGAPPSLVFHAEAERPPVSHPCGRPTGRCALAADPRGPPLG